MYENFRSAQNELVQILNKLPKEVKDETRKKMQTYFQQEWEKTVKPIIPESLQDLANIIMKEKIKNFDFETQLSKFNLEEFINQFEPLKENFKKSVK